MSHHSVQENLILASAQQDVNVGVAKNHAVANWQLANFQMHGESLTILQLFSLLVGILGGLVLYTLVPKLPYLLDLLL